MSWRFWKCEALNPVSFSWLVATKSKAFETYPDFPHSNCYVGTRPIRSPTKILWNQHDFHTFVGLKGLNPSFALSFRSVSKPSPAYSTISAWYPIFPYSDLHFSGPPRQPWQPRQPGGFPLSLPMRWEEAIVTLRVQYVYQPQTTRNEDVSSIFGEVGNTPVTKHGNGKSPCIDF